ncbi:MAG: ethanolamine ammonia-lyase [Candidatus Methylumidiphilus alinenensis]|uniref:Ethanolamine ammonia-lyase small subunit n=1 Tax=Candidatus Methylumidiphilus alinenensis TaxID=2202197 RepID=A0A2W4T306_9GAMM|nr:MAG: ethanolamine ammonia-lyase [Candidatus Methylumidiphilus alinenensis]
MTDPWIALRRFTQARIALGRAGHAVPTQALLDFQLAHAQARDAVQLPWNIDAFAGQLRDIGEETLILQTPVSNRSEYLRRPDFGRVLTEESRIRLRNLKASGVDVALIVSNGLSSTAVERRGIALLQTILEGLRVRQFRIAPISLVANGRVALLDDIGSVLGARVSVIVIGERPGLSAADSLGIYLSYAPKKGNTDAERNCISNIHPPEGLSYESATKKLLYLIEESIRRGFSGVALKDEMDGLLAEGKPLIE